MLLNSTMQCSAQAAISHQLRTWRSNVSYFSMVVRQMSPPISCLCWALGVNYALRGQMSPFFQGSETNVPTYFLSAMIATFLPVSYSEGSTVLRVPLRPICACATMSGTAGICHSYSESSPPRLTVPHLSCFAVVNAECSHLPPTPSAVLSVPLWLGYISPLPFLLTTI